MTRLFLLVMRALSGIALGLLGSLWGHYLPDWLYMLLQVAGGLIAAISIFSAVRLLLKSERYTSISVNAPLDECLDAIRSTCIPAVIPGWQDDMQSVQYPDSNSFSWVRRHVSGSVAYLSCTLLADGVEIRQSSPAREVVSTTKSSAAGTTQTRIEIHTVSSGKSGFLNNIRSRFLGFEEWEYNRQELASLKGQIEMRSALRKAFGRFNDQ